MLCVSHSCFFWTVRKSKFIDKLCSLRGSNFVTTLNSQFPDHVSLSLWNEAEWLLFAKEFDGPYYENCWECSVFLRSLDFNHGAWDCFIKKVSLCWLKKFKAVAVICQMQSFILATIFITDSSLWNNGCPVYKKSRKHSSFSDFKCQWRIRSWLTACGFWRMLFLFPLSRTSFRVNSTRAIKRSDATRIVMFLTDLCCLPQCTPFLVFHLYCETRCSCLDYKSSEAELKILILPTCTRMTSCVVPFVSQLFSLCSVVVQYVKGTSVCL